MSQDLNKAVASIGQNNQGSEVRLFLSQVPAAVVLNMVLQAANPITKCLAGIRASGDNTSIQFLLT
jgi:hypothetical protein